MSDPASPLDRLRRRYRELHGAPPKTFDLSIQRIAGGDLVAVYREPEWAEVEEITTRWRQDSDEPRDELYGYAELLAKACVDILLRDDEHPDAVERPGRPGKYLPGLGLGGGPVSFHAAAQALDMPVDAGNPLVAVFSILGGAHGGDYEVERHGTAVSSWEPRLASPEVDEQFVGESEGAPPPGASPAGT